MLYVKRNSAPSKLPPRLLIKFKDSYLKDVESSLPIDTLQISRLFCEPHALNVAPNRTLQAAGFKYVKTHETVPGPFNFHQPVTRWVLEKA